MSQTKLHFSFPLLYYMDSHRNERGGYIYADDLFNSNNWASSLSDFDGKITRYFHVRDEKGKVDDDVSVRTIDLRQRGISETNQTLVGNLINHYINISIGAVIRQQYEHYKPPQVESNTTASINNVDSLVKITSEYSEKVLNIKDSLNSNIRNLLSPNKIEYHEQYLVGEKNIKNIQVSKNPNLSEFQILPEMIGVDVSSISSGINLNEKYSIQVASGSLIGWNYTSPQEACLGCAGDFSSILCDIIWLIMNKNDFNPNEGQVKWTFQTISPFYNALITSNLIGILENINEDFGTDIFFGSESRNPMVLGIRNNISRVPDIYGLWCIYRITRTPFYNRNVVKTGEVTIDVDQFFPYVINSDIDITSKTIGEIGSIDSIKKSIIENLKESTKITGETMSEFQLAVSESKMKTSDIWKESINRIVKRLESKNNTFWKTLISLCVGNIGMNLLAASQVPWVELAQKAGDSSSFGDLKVMNFRGKINLRKQKIIRDLSANAYISLQSFVKANFGTSITVPMGGTSLQGNIEFSDQRFSEQVTYPGDTNLMETMAGYFDLLNSDLNAIGSTLQIGLEKLSRKYWYRDVVRWLEVIFKIFQLGKDVSKSGSETQMLSFRFSQMEKIVKLLYTKQIGFMKDFIQKANSLERRTESGKGAPDPALERQMRLVSMSAITSICYLKRQILIIFYILTKIGTNSPFLLDKRTTPKEIYSGQQWLGNFRTFQVKSVSWFKLQVGDIMRSVTNPNILKLVQNFASDEICGASIISEPTSVSQKYMSDDKTNEIVTDPRFWLLAMAGLKAKDPSTVGTAPQLLKKLFLPVYEISGNKKKYYLFDIISFVIKGELTGTFGTKSPPLWYDYNELNKAIFTKEDQGFIVVTNVTTQLSNTNNWKAFDISWLKNLLNQAIAFSQKEPGSQENKKMWLIRFSMYLFFKDPSIYENISKQQGTYLGSEAVITSPETPALFRSKLKSIQQMSDSEKDNEKLFLSLISREYFERELLNSITMFGI
jgi:hypothetical protein